MQNELIYRIDENEVMVLGTIMTNHGMTIDEAIDLLDLDMDRIAAEQGWEGWSIDEMEFREVSE